MKASRALRWARLTAGLIQRVLAEKSGIRQSTIARIETGAIDPRVGTLSRRLHACEFDLEVEPLLSIGIDRSLIHQCLASSPAQRLQNVDVEAENLRMLLAATRHLRRRPVA